MRDLSREVLAELQGGLPLVPEPFTEVASRLGVSQEAVLACLGELGEQRVVRRFGARIDQRRVGLTVNAMVGWFVPDPEVEVVGQILAADPEVTHCYERTTVPGRWDYNLFTVLHQPDRESLDRRLAALSAETGMEDCVALVSGREFKRVPAARFLPAAVPPGRVRR
jgi:DNA-binding Lrp family transcriptional regulator